MVGVPRPPLKSCNRATALAGALSASTAMGLRRLSSLLLLRWVRLLSSLLLTRLERFSAESTRCRGFQPPLRRMTLYRVIIGMRLSFTRRTARAKNGESFASRDGPCRPYARLAKSRQAQYAGCSCVNGLSAYGSGSPTTQRHWTYFQSTSGPSITRGTIIYGAGPRSPRSLFGGCWGNRQC